MIFKNENEENLREEWNEIPTKGMLPDDMKLRMWTNIQKVTINRRKRNYRWVAAACVFILLSIGAYHSFTTNLFLPQAKTVAAKTFPQDIRLLRLPDGTRVWINQNTEIEYPEQFENNQRRITLKGEAFFEVAKDPNRPFIITSGEITTTVLGTSFNVKAYSHTAPQVHVRTGKVKVQGTQNTVYLQRGYAAIFDPKMQSIKKQKITVLEPEWKKAIIDIDGLTLAQVMVKLQAIQPFTVAYSTADLENLKIKGTLDARQGFDEMLQTVAFALEIDIKPSGNNSYTISK